MREMVQGSAHASGSDVTNPMNRGSTGIFSEYWGVKKMENIRAKYWAGLRYSDRHILIRYYLEFFLERGHSLPPASGLRPCFAATHATQDWVQNLSHIIPLEVHGLIPGMLSELPTYRALAVLAEPFNRGGVTEYSDGLLKWWKANNPTISSWAKAARIVFALTITSAASERVFSACQVHVRQGPRHQRLQMSSRAQSMLRYNKRSVG